MKTPEAERWTAQAAAADAPRKRVALIAGPTASGKSALALALAEATGGTIINADASQVYRDLRIVTARPSPEEEALVPHRLFGTRDADDPASAAEWAKEAKEAIRTATVPILVGGTGLYIRTLLDGIAPVPAIDPAVRASVRALPGPALVEALSVEDPEAAARLRPSDMARLARALEVVRSTGRPLASWQKDLQGGIADAIDLVPLLLLPPREWLRERIATRFEAMIQAGAVEEVEALLARSLDPALPAMRAIGVPEIAAWLRREIDRGTMITRAVDASRRYAKRQYTWFRHQPPAPWPRQQEQLTSQATTRIVIKLRDKLLTR